MGTGKARGGWKGLNTEHRLQSPERSKHCGCCGNVVPNGSGASVMEN